MIWVFHKGELVPKDSVPLIEKAASTFPTPRVSRFEPMESPVTGETISSWRARDRDMAAVDAVDVRDYPKGHEFKRGRKAQTKEAMNATRRTTT